MWWWGTKEPTEAGLSFWEIYCFRILMFFYQITVSINILIPNQSDKSSDNLSVIEAFFNFDLSAIENLYKICAFDDMTNLDKVLLGFLGPIFCILWLIIFSFLKWIGIYDLKRYCTTNVVWRNAGNFILRFYFYTAIVKFFVSVYSTMTRIAFELITCRPFDDGKDRMYFAADIECYEGWHALIFMLIMLSILAPFALLYRLWISRIMKIQNAWFVIIKNK